MTKQERIDRILKNCPNYDVISNHVYLEDDDFSKKIIDMYQDYVFDVDVEDKHQIKHICKIDKAIHRYIKDHGFHKEVKENFAEYINNDDLDVDGFMKSIVEFFKCYEEKTLRQVVSTKWI
jgi:hypothetical protein